MVDELILLFDEDVGYAAGLLDALQGARYSVTRCDSPADALEQLEQGRFDLFITGACLQNSEGQDLLWQARQISRSIPILIIAENPSLDSALHALRHHVRDYLPKSTSAETVLVRVQAILDEARRDEEREAILSQMMALLNRFYEIQNEAYPRYSSTPAQQNQVIQLGSISVNLTTREVMCEGKQVTLSPTELAYFTVLLRHQPEVVSHKLLVQEAQGFELSKFEAENLARWHIHGLRKTLQEVLGKNIIVTVRGAGYSIKM